MNGITLQLKKLTTKKDKGFSKIFGSPDVWSGFEWPAVTDGDDCYDLDFLAQINCSDASAFDGLGLVPKNGMLYFFYDFEGCPTDFNDKNAARVLFYGGNTDKLEELVMVDEDGVDCALCTPQRVFFSASGYNTKNTKLKMFYQDEDYKDYVVLLKINSFSSLDKELHFNDIGEMLFLIEKDRLRSLDFSDVRVTVKYK